MTAWWAWARDGSAMHAFEMTEEQVRRAKANGTEHKTICDWTTKIGERPTRRPHDDAVLNHCDGCWNRLNPKAGIFLPNLVLPEIRRTS